MQAGLGDPEATNADVESVTAKALDLATAFDQDVGAASAAAGQLIRTGLAKDATEAFDIITAGMQSGVNKSGDFLETLNEYSPQFAKLGISGTQALGILQDGLKAGARDTDVIADAFKEFSIRSIDGSKLTAEGFKLAGLDAKTMAAEIAKGGDSALGATQQTLEGLLAIKDPQAQNTAGVALFGTQSEDTARGILYIPVEEAGPDFWGGDRHGMNLFANCLVAPDATTGTRPWHYQLVHPDVPDKHPPTPPVLLPIAERSCLATLLWLEATGRARPSGDAWRRA